ncbi:hypothetical protein Mal4_52800 [Maioricimonas rarisocia]|uniref:Uncharacterized protein n=1 Tax=Maioricimonas rarisocia TaxID=2528026 RepID=A0A517ZEL4_9PLAN|nr:tetratricopeptide repeat protein [Maioricimonas rarisocia]QDU40917.1 hypothetical protein Mal4_52800 [Maioricimonas rarisocia]
MDSMIEEAQQACSSGDLGRAEGILRTHLRDDQHDGPAWELLGRVLFQQGWVADSVSALETATMLVPLQPASRVCLAHGYGQLGRKELSRDLLVAMIPDPFLSVHLLLQVAGGLDAVGHSELAVQACRSAVRREPDHAQAYYDLGYYMARSGSPTGIVESLARKAVALEPDNVRFRLGLASLLIQDGRHAEGYACVERLKDRQIANIACPCCLRRVVNLFGAAGDSRRVALCQTRLNELEQFGVASDCD